MTTFTVTYQGGEHVLRDAEYTTPDHGISVTTVRHGPNSRPGIRLTQCFGEITFSQALTADIARALAAELLASADAIDAVMAERGKA